MGGLLLGRLLSVMVDSCHFGWCVYLKKVSQGKVSSIGLALVWGEAV